MSDNTKIKRRMDNMINQMRYYLEKYDNVTITDTMYYLSSIYVQLYELSAQYPEVVPEENKFK